MEQWWPWISAALLAIVGLFAGGAGKVWLTAKRTKEQQAKEAALVERSLSDVNVTKITHMNEEKLARDAAVRREILDHAARLQAIEAASDRTVDDLSRRPDDLPGGLVDSLSESERKLRGGS